MKAKKLSAIILASMILTGVMTACGDDNTNTTDTTTTTNTASSVSQTVAESTDEYSYGIAQNEDFVYQKPARQKDGIILKKYIGTAEEAVIPDEIEGVEVHKIDSDFLLDSSVKKVTLSDNVTELKERAFAGCTTLEEVVMSKNLDVVYKNAFKNCTALKEVEFYDELDYISDNVFEGCESLEKVTFAENGKMTNLGIKLFADCVNLKEVYLPAEIKTIGKNITKGCSDDLILYVKAGSSAEEYAKENELNYQIY